MWASSTTFILGEQDLISRLASIGFSFIFQLVISPPRVAHLNLLDLAGSDKLSQQPTLSKFNTNGLYIIIFKPNWRQSTGKPAAF